MLDDEASAVVRMELQQTQISEKFNFLVSQRTTKILTKSVHVKN
jgi:hypothetical protein